MKINTPDWVKDAVFYQVFPDRFATSKRVPKIGLRLEDWDIAPTTHGFSRNAALRERLDAAHARDIKVVLDGVFNHASRGFWQFHHMLENGAGSPYKVKLTLLFPSATVSS